MAAKFKTSAHASWRSLPYFIKVGCIQAGANVKGPPLRSLSRLSNIKAALTNTAVKQQIYIRPHRSVIFRRKCHFPSLSGSKLEGSATRYCIGFWLPAWTDKRFLPASPSSVTPTYPPSPAPLTAPQLSSPRPRPFSLLSLHSHLFPTCQDDFQACCLRPDLVSYE